MDVEHGDPTYMTGYNPTVRMESLIRQVIRQRRTTNFWGVIAFGIRLAPLVGIWWELRQWRRLRL